MNSWYNIILLFGIWQILCGVNSSIKPQAINQSEINSSTSKNTCISIILKKNIKIQQPKYEESFRYLLPLIKHNYNEREESNGVYKINFHATLNALYDLLIYWGCKPTTLIFEAETGFDRTKLLTYFNQRSALCHPQIIENSAKLEIVKCNNLFESRYFIYIGQQQIFNFFSTVSLQCPNLFRSMRTWIVVAGYRHIANFKTPELRSFISSSWSQITFLVPQETRTVSHSMFLEYGLASRVDLYDVFYSPSTLKTEVIPFAKWTPKLRLYLYERIPDNQGLRGRTVRVITARPACPMVCYGGIKADKLLPSYSVDLFSVLERSLQVNHIYEIQNVNIGMSSPNGSFNGLLGYLQRGEFDLCMIPSVTTEERKVLAVRYNLVGVNGDMRIIIKQPLPLVPPTIYFLPFQISVWLTVAVILFFTVSIMLLTHRFYSIRYVNKYRCEKKDTLVRVNRRTIKLDFFDQDDINGLAEAIVMLTLYVAVLLIFTYYTSILTSVFAYRDIKLPFNSMEELIKRDDYTVLTPKHTIYHKAFEVNRKYNVPKKMHLVVQYNGFHFLKSAKDGPYKSIWKKFLTKNKEGLLPDFLSGFGIVAQKEKHAYFTSGFVFQRLVESSCSLMFVPKKYMLESYNIPFRKDFPFYKVYSTSVLKLYEGGILRRFEKLHLTSGAKTQCKNLEVSQTLELKQTFILFVFLFASFFIVLITLLIEKIVYIYKQHHKY